MSAYDNDPRVEQHNEWAFFVSTPIGRYSVYTQNPGVWVYASMAAPEAGFSKPFGSADAAIRRLIGGPR
jgi:hypothetical protein